MFQRGNFLSGSLHEITFSIDRRFSQCHISDIDGKMPKEIYEEVSQIPFSLKKSNALQVLNN